MTTNSMKRRKKWMSYGDSKDVIQKLKDKHQFVDLLQLQLKISNPIKKKRKPWFKRN